MEYSYNFRIYPTPSQIKQIQQTFGSVRFVYNYYLTKRKELFEQSHETFNYYDCAKDLTNLKKELEWLQIPDSTALQSSLKHLDIAFQNFFRGIKKNQQIGFPKYKSRKNHAKSYESKCNGKKIEIFENKIKLPKLGFVKCKVSKRVKGKILHAVVSQRPSGKYYVSVCCTNVDIEPLLKTEKACGIDVGIKDLMILSDGTKICNHKYLSKSEKRLVRLQRQLSRKPSDSKRHEKARIKVARLHEHVANQRRDTIQKATTKIIHDFDIICIEDLNTKGMLRNHRLAKSISDACFGEIRRELEYKAQLYGKQVIKIDRFFPSSQTCSCCGFKWEKLKDLSIRSWTCPSCKTQHDRDINASINILKEGLKLVS